MHDQSGLASRRRIQVGAMAGWNPFESFGLCAGIDIFGANRTLPIHTAAAVQLP